MAPRPAEERYRGGGAATSVAPFAGHGGGAQRGLDAARSSGGRFGRLFPHLAPDVTDRPTLEALARSMFPGAPPAESVATILEPGENPDLAAGYTYLEQFVDHDITFDPVSLVERQGDPEDLRSLRSPRFDLDSVYGSGPTASPYLYDQDDPVKLLVGHNTSDRHEPDDLPRNQQGRAIVIDPRNDVHVIISQLHLAFIRFHNAVVDHLRDQFLPGGDLFVEAQRLTRWHYQWVVVEDLLRHLVDADILDDILVVDPTTGGRTVRLQFYRWEAEPFIPVEFSAAAFRFGHSQVRARYRLNAGGEPIHVLVPFRTPNPYQHLGGFRPLPRGWRIDWDQFFPVGTSTPQLSRRIDTKLTGSFSQLPVAVDPERRSLALLDLLRARALDLPSGQTVAEAMGVGVPDHELRLGGDVPLWYYVLREAEVLRDGRRLGPAGGRLVAEVLLGMLAGDPASFLHAEPPWEPELPGEQPGRFTMVDLLRFADRPHSVRPR